MDDNSKTPVTSTDTETRRREIIRSRNRVTALVLLGFVLLFFAITIVKMKI